MSDPNSLNMDQARGNAKVDAITLSIVWSKLMFKLLLNFEHYILRGGQICWKFDIPYYGYWLALSAFPIPVGYLVRIPSLEIPISQGHAQRRAIELRKLAVALCRGQPVRSPGLH